MGKGIRTTKFKISDLLKLYKRKRVWIQPSFQREFVWTPRQQKNLIKSILNGIPLPYFYFAKTKESILEVIDGQQRLTTLFGYKELKSVKHAREKITKEFLKDRYKFDGEDYFKKDILKILKKYKINSVIIDETRWDANKKYEMFEILNQGGTRLTGQEIRHCTLDRVNEDLNLYLKKGARKLDKLIGPKEHLYNEELTLRFFAINRWTYEDKVTNDINPNKWVNFKGKDLKKLFNNFTKFVKTVEDIYPETKKLSSPLYFKTLKKDAPLPRSDKDNFYSYQYSQDINQAYFHLLSYYIPKYEKYNKFNRISNRKKQVYLLNFLRKDRRIKTLTGAGTDSPNKIKQQKELFEKYFVSSVGDYTQRERRQITNQEKETLLSNFNYCYLCYKQIINKHSVEPDHVAPYSKGYMSKFHNILLACKKCNKKKLGKSPEAYRNGINSKKQRIKNKKNIKRYLKELELWHAKYKLKWHKLLVQYAEEDLKLKIDNLN